jgi:hypothetical protein
MEPNPAHLAGGGSAAGSGEPLSEGSRGFQLENG